MFLPLDHIVDNISSVKVSHVSYRSCFERRLPSIKLSFIRWVLDCKTVAFFLKIGKAWRKSPTRAKHASLAEAREKDRLSPVSLSVFSLVPDLLFDCSRVPEYAKIRTVLQSSWVPGFSATGQSRWRGGIFF